MRKYLGSLAVLCTVASFAGISSASAGGWNVSGGCGCASAVAYASYAAVVSPVYAVRTVATPVYVVNQGPVYSAAAPAGYPGYYDEGSAEPYPYVRRRVYDGGPYSNPMNHRYHSYRFRSDVGYAPRPIYRGPRVVSYQGGYQRHSYRHHGPAPRYAQPRYRQPLLPANK
jgi:hypothetical protein